MSLPHSCQRCFHRKQKCDRARPSCSLCASAGVACVPRLVGHVAEDEPNSVDTINSSASTIDYMLRRIRYLEQTNSNGFSAPAKGHNGQTTGQNHSQAATLDKSPGNESTYNEAETPSSERIMDHAVNEIGYLSLAAMADQSDHDSIYQGHLSYANFIMASLNLPSRNPSRTASQCTKSFNQPQTKLWLGSLDDKRLSLADADFSEYVTKFICYTSMFHPCVAGDKCMEAYETVRKAEQDGTIGQQEITSPEKVVLAYAGVAQGMLMSGSEHSIRHVIPGIMKKINDAVPRLVERASNLAIIESLIIMAILGIHSPLAGSTWYFVGLAMSKAVSLGMHRQKTRPARISAISLREEMFWTLYRMERIDDADIDLKLPNMPRSSCMHKPEIYVKALHLWAVHHSQMLSDWRNDQSQHPQFYLSTFDYWKNTYQGLAETVIENFDGHEGWERAAFQLGMLKYESQLLIRAIIQLVAICSNHQQDSSAARRIRDLAIQEAPLFLSYLQDAIEKFDVFATFVDAFDVFAAGIIYIYALHCSVSEDQKEQTSYMVVSNASALESKKLLEAKDVKVIASCGEILTHTGERFSPIRTMKEVLWSFLAATETKLSSIRCNDVQHTSGLSAEMAWDHAAADMLASVQKCEVEIPAYIGRIMSSCLALDLELT